MIRAYHALALAVTLILAQGFAEWIDGQEPVYVKPRKPFVEMWKR